MNYELWVVSFEFDKTFNSVFTEESNIPINQIDTLITIRVTSFIEH